MCAFDSRPQILASDGAWLKTDGITKRHGRGVYVDGASEEQKYEGEWVDDQMQGRGTFTYASGAKYEVSICAGACNTSDSSWRAPTLNARLHTPACPYPCPCLCALVCRVSSRRTSTTDTAPSPSPTVPSTREISRTTKCTARVCILTLRAWSGRASSTTGWDRASRQALLSRSDRFRYASWHVRSRCSLFESVRLGSTLWSHGMPRNSSEPRNAARASR